MGKLENHVKHLNRFRKEIDSRIIYLIKDYDTRYGIGGYSEDRGKKLAKYLQKIIRELENIH